MLRNKFQIKNNQNYLQKWHAVRYLEAKKLKTNRNYLALGAIQNMLKNYVGKQLITNANKYVQGTNKKRRRGGQIHINTLGYALERHTPMARGGALKTNNNYARAYTQFTEGRFKNKKPPTLAGRMIRYAQTRNMNNFSPNIHKTARAIYNERNSLARRRSARIIRNHLRSRMYNTRTKKVKEHFGNAMANRTFNAGQRGKMAIPNFLINKIAGMSARLR